MPHIDALNHSEYWPAPTSDGTKLHEKNYLPKANGSEADKRPENVWKNIGMAAQNINAAQPDKSRESCPIHQGKMQSESNQQTEIEDVVKNTEKKRSVLKENNAVATSKTSKTICSCACCMSDKELVENTVKNLQNQIHGLTEELSNNKTENQLLRKDINRAKTVVKRDIGRNVESFEDIVKKMTEDSWIGQQEKIVSLKKELRELKEELREKELRPPSPVKRRESVSPKQISDDRKIHWRLKLERQSILRQTEREKNDLIEDRGRMKGKLELILNRNKDLEKQIESIRREIKETGKGPNGNFISLLHEVERKAKFCLEEKARLRRSIEEEETKEKQLLKKIDELETEIKSQKKTFEITKETLSRKKSDEDAVVSLLNTFDIEASSGMNDVNKNLNKVEEEQNRNMKRLSILTDLLFEFEELFSQQRLRSPLSRRADDESCRTSISVDTFNKESPERVQNERTDSKNEMILTSTVKEIMQVRRESILEEAETVMQDNKGKLDRTLVADDDQELSTDESSNFEDECNKLVKLFRDKDKENLKKSEHIYDLLDRIKEKTEEMLRNNSQLWRIASQIKIMLYTNKRLQKLVKNYANTLVSEKHGFCHTTWDDLIHKGESIYSILGKENMFLKSLITSIAESKAYDFDLYTFSCKRKEIFSQQQIIV